VQVWDASLCTCFWELPRPSDGKALKVSCNVENRRWQSLYAASVPRARIQHQFMMTMKLIYANYVVVGWPVGRIWAALVHTEGCNPVESRLVIVSHALSCAHIALVA
jgi:hypothetical protein